MFDIARCHLVTQAHEYNRPAVAYKSCHTQRSLKGMSIGYTSRLSLQHLGEPALLFAVNSTINSMAEVACESQIILSYILQYVDVQCACAQMLNVCVCTPCLKTCAAFCLWSMPCMTPDS